MGSYDLAHRKSYCRNYGSVNYCGTDRCRPTVWETSNFNSILICFSWPWSARPALSSPGRPSPSCASGRSFRRRRRFRQVSVGFLELDRDGCVLGFWIFETTTQKYFPRRFHCSGIKEFWLARRLHSAEATILASNPAAPGSIPGVPEKFSQGFIDGAA